MTTFIGRMRQKRRAEVSRRLGYCVRHPYRERNPASKSYCDNCLDYWLSRKPPKQKATGRNLIQRMEAGQ